MPAVLHFMFKHARQHELFEQKKSVISEIVELR